MAMASATLRPLPLLSLAMVMAMEDTVITVVMVATDMVVTDTAMASATLRPLPLLSPAMVTEGMAMEVTVITAVTAVTVTDTAMASVMLSLAMDMVDMEAMAVTVEATAADME